MSGARLYRVEELSADGAGTVRVPVMGPALCAGFPSPADDFQEQAIELPRSLVPAGGLAGLDPTVGMQIADQMMHPSKCFTT